MSGSVGHARLENKIVMMQVLVVLLLELYGKKKPVTNASRTRQPLLAITTTIGSLIVRNPLVQLAYQ